MLTRVGRLRSLLEERGLDGLVTLRESNVRYLSGFSGSGALYIAAGATFLLSDFRYAQQAAAESPACTFVLVKDRTLVEAVAGLLRERQGGKVAVEDDHLSHRDWGILAEKSGCALHPADGMIESMRLVKDPAEIEALSRACRIADEALAEVLPQVRPGLKENEVAARLEFTMRLKGAAAASFETICASGPHSAMPHATATDRLLQAGDLVTLDFGAIWCGYHSDVTRTFVLGPPSPEQASIYRLVREAQALGVAAVRPGAATAAVDAVVRDRIAAAGHGEHFGHSTGHGVGLAVHEQPRLAKKDEGVLQAGMVVTVEPGVYLPGRGGVRIEDTVLVTEDGCRVLTGAPKIFELKK